MKRFDTLTAFVLAAGGLAAALGGCELIATVDRSQINGTTTGVGGSTTSSTTSTTDTNSTSTSSTGTGGMCAGGVMACSAPGDCPMPASECVDRTCDMGCCGTTNKGNGVATATQTTGDCNKSVCDGMGATKQTPDDTDLPAGSDACHVGTCSNGTTGQAPAATGTACMLTGGGNGVCGDTNGGKAGTCIECNTTADCTSPAICDSSNACVSPKCNDNTQDGTETDVDCGGSCSGCANGKKCLVDGDCQSSNCDGTKHCAAPSCSDSKQDGTETDVDCGGSTCDGQNKTCADGKKCAVSADCTNGFCDTTATPPVCKAPSCTDGVQDGTESDVDCGATCGAAKLCANGKKCGSAADCQSGVCDGTNHCNTLPDGDKTCTSDAQCANGNCVANGTGAKICCHTACSGTCQACSAAFTGGTDGTCADVTAGHAPAAATQCATGTTCGPTGVCAAGGMCQEASTSVVCAPATCVMGATSYQFVGPTDCDGNGSCGTPPAGTDCGQYGCDNTTGCKTNCANGSLGADCAPNRICVPGGSVRQCLLTTGQPCTMNNQCANTLCILGDGGTGGVCN